MQNCGQKPKLAWMPAQSLYGGYIGASVALIRRVVMLLLRDILR